MVIKKLKRRIGRVIVDNLGFVRHRYNRNDRMGMLHRSWGYIFTNLIKGAYYEFGLYKGESFITSWQAYLDYKKWVMNQLVSIEPWRRQAMRDYASYRHEFYGFDSFEGIPENSEGNTTFAKGNFVCSYEEVEKKCIQSRMHYRLFKGFFSQIKKSELVNLEPAAIVNIDSDLYLSAAEVFELIKDKLQQGTILLLDDYNCFSSSDSAGERRALIEFCHKYPQYSFEPWMPYFLTGQSFICHVNKK